MILLAPAFGCEYLRWTRARAVERSEYAKEPTLTLAKELAPEDCFVLTGRFTLPPEGPRSVLVVARDHSSPAHELVGSREATADTGYYAILLPSGVYDILVFADLDLDGYYDTHEVIGRTPLDAPAVVGLRGSADGAVVSGPDLTLGLPAPSASETPVHAKASKNPLVVSSLDDPIFAPELGELGVYYPNRFLARVQRWVFALGEPDLSKTQVVLVHGIEGTPRDFAAMAAGLDRSRFQIWLFYYPSGLHLDNLGIVLARAIETIAREIRSPDPSLVLVGHSMGGLVGRRAVNELCRNGRPGYLKGYASFDTPYGGIREVVGAEKRGRELVASWRDLASDSDFLNRLHATPIPADLPFELFFGWGEPGSQGPSPAGDGTIRLDSQLDPRAQAAARRMLGFGQTHVGILADPGAIRALSEFLEEAAGNGTADGRPAVKGQPGR